MGLFNKLFGGGKKTSTDAATSAGPSAPADPAAGSASAAAASAPAAHAPASARSPAPAPAPAPASSLQPAPQPPPSAALVCGLQILYPRAPEWLAEDIVERLTAHHSSFAGVQVTLQATKENANGTVLTRGAGPSNAGGTALEVPPSQVFHLTWDRHAADLAVLEIPLPGPVIDTCLQGAFFSEDLKREASYHGAHALIWYDGAAEDRLEQMVALALLAGGLAGSEGLAVVNENGCTACSVEQVRGTEGIDPLEHLQQLPIPMLYAGVKIFEIPNQAGAWARTFGCALLQLPDLALQMLRPGAGEEHLMLLSRVLAELAAAKTPLTEGMGMQINERAIVRFREPRAGEFWLESPNHALFVVEIAVTEPPTGDAAAADSAGAIEAPPPA